jgi:hypothetical protein
VWLDGGEYQALATRRVKEARPALIACASCRNQMPMAESYYTRDGLSECKDCHHQHAADVQQARAEVAVLQQRQAQRRAFVDASSELGRDTAAGVRIWHNVTAAQEMNELRRSFGLRGISSDEL